MLKPKNVRHFRLSFKWFLSIPDVVLVTLNNMRENTVCVLPVKSQLWEKTSTTSGTSAVEQFADNDH